MKDRINKTSICSVVFIDIIDYSKKPVSDQIAEKECFNALLTEAIKNVAQNDRIILDTGDGAAIALMGAPEEALFVSLTIRDGILRSNKEDGMHLRVRTGINLGPVRVVTDINGMPNIIGDGINVAQRIMTFAEPNQILVSRSYYEVTSRLTEEITRMFAYSGVKQDKHVREHEVYVIKSPTDEAELAGTPATAAVPAEAEAQAAAGGFFRQRYLFPVALVLFIGVVLAGVLLPGWLFSPDQAEHAAQTSDALGTTAADTPASAPVAAATPLQAQRPPEKAQSP
ncbi:MAG TPA: adenylate/guanylate cyclase domain-containing protein [Methylophilaceae bacterium]|nr:adenylate/guanylate cyclase domain-containing protein [Methylophilaceae bacterium]